MRGSEVLVYPRSVTNEADLLDTIARRLEDPEPYLAYAAWLDAAQDPRGELVRLQLALETAKGEEGVALREKERAWLLSHREHLFGPFAPLIVSDVDKNPWPSVFGWYRGFLTRIALDRIAGGRAQNPGDPPDGIVRLSAAKAAQGLLHPVARHCRVLEASAWPRRLPPGVEQVRIHQGVVTARLLAEPALRTLELRAVAGGEPLVHAGLETLKLTCDEAGIDLLASSELPALKRLVCWDLLPDPALLTRLASAVARLGAIDVELVFLVSSTRRFSELHVGPDAVSALRPVAERIVALSVPADTYGAVTELDWDLELPRLARLDVCGCPSARSLRAPAWRTIRELSLSRAYDARTSDTSVAALCESGLAPQLRCLRVFFEAPDQPDAARTLAAQPFDRLEELVLNCGIKARPPLDLFGGIAEGAFPALRRVEVPGYDLASFGQSTLAPRIERLTLDLSAEEIERLPAPIAEIVRERFPRAELAPKGNYSRTYWTDDRWGASSRRPLPPQMDGWSRATSAPDLSAFPELAQLWAWARQLIANQRTFPRDTLDSLQPSAYARVLTWPFLERDPSFAPPPAAPKQAPTTFATATRDHVVRRVLRHWVGMLVAESGGDTTFEGDLERGSYGWDDMEGASYALAWNKVGVVAFASDIYGTGDNTEVDAKSILGKVPRPIRSLADGLVERRGAGAMSAMWIAPAARHRHPSEGGGSGFEHLAFFVSDAPFVPPCNAPSPEQDALAEALTKQILAGGGPLTDEQSTLLDTQPDGAPRPESERAKVTAALEALGLRRAKAGAKRRAKPKG